MSKGEVNYIVIVAIVAMAILILIGVALIAIYYPKLVALGVQNGILAPPGG